MSKFKIKLKITGFELEVEGNRDDVPLIANSVGQQIAGLLEPATTIIEGDTHSVDEVKQLNPPQSKTNHRPQRKSPAKKVAGPDHEQTLDWQHDPSKWGAPQQSWNTAQKSIWLLFVASQELGITELSGVCIRNTFNKHFKQSKGIILNNINRDLGKLKVKTKAPVAEDTTRTPTKWYLTQEGAKMAQELIQQARGLENGSN